MILALLSSRVCPCVDLSLSPEVIDKFQATDFLHRETLLTVWPRSSIVIFTTKAIMPRRPAGFTRRFVDSGGFPFGGSSHSKFRSSPLLSVVLILLAPVHSYYRSTRNVVLASMAFPHTLSMIPLWFKFPGSQPSHMPRLWWVRSVF